MKTFKKYIGPVSIGLLTAIAIGSFIFAAIATDSILVKAISKHWNRSIDIEQLQTFRREGDWLPNGSRVIKSWTESYIAFRTESYSTGFGKNRRSHTRLVPETRTKTVYQYDIDEWTMNRTLTTSGAANGPFWPDISNLHTGDVVGCERTKTYSQKYVIEVENRTDEPYKYKNELEVELNLWQAVPVNCPLVIELNKFKYVTNISPLENP